MQEIRRFKPSTVARAFSVTAGCSRTFSSTAPGALAREHVRLPAVPPLTGPVGFRSPHPAVSDSLLNAPRSANRATVARFGHNGSGVPLLAWISKPPRTHRRSRRGARPRVLALWARHQDRPGPAATSGRPGHRPGTRPPGTGGAILLTPSAPGWDRHAGQPRRSYATSPRPPASGRQGAPAHAPHTFVTTSFDAAFTCATSNRPPAMPHQRTTMRTPARNNLYLHPNPTSWPPTASGTLAISLRRPLPGRGDGPLSPVSERALCGVACPPYRLPCLMSPGVQSMTN